MRQTTLTTYYATKKTACLLPTDLLVLVTDFLPHEAVAWLTERLKYVSVSNLQTTQRTVWGPRVRVDRLGRARVYMSFDFTRSVYGEHGPKPHLGVTIALSMLLVEKPRRSFEIVRYTYDPPQRRTIIEFDEKFEPQKTAQLIWGCIPETDLDNKTMKMPLLTKFHPRPTRKWFKSRFTF